MPRILTMAIVFALVLATRSAHADRGDRWDGDTVFYQSATGAGGMLVGGSVGGITGFLLTRNAERGNWAKPILGILGGIVVGGAIGTVIGVQEAGDSRGGTGRYYATSIGMIGSLLVATGIAYVHLERDKGLPLYVLIPT